MDIRECDEKYTLKELKAICASHGLPTGGSKRSLCLSLIRAGVFEGKILRWSGSGQPGEDLLKSGGSADKIREMVREGKQWSEVSDWVTRQIGYDPEVLDWARDIYNEARKTALRYHGSMDIFTEPISDADKALADIAARFQSTEQWDAIAKRLGMTLPRKVLGTERPPTTWEKNILFYLMVGYKLKPGISLKEARGDE